MCGAIPPFHQYVFMAWCLVKAQDNVNQLGPAKLYWLTLDLGRRHLRRRLGFDAML
jgi:hypothetical protein